jgi:hypothetical protein
MRKLIGILLAAACTGIIFSQAGAQPPGGKGAEDTAKQKSKDFSNSPIVTRMMAFDKNKDGKLTKDEVTDPRLQRLFDQADTNKDGVVTKEELMALAAKLEAEYGQAGGRGGFGGPGGPGPGDFGPRGRGRGGRGGPGGPGADRGQPDRGGQGQPGGFGGPGGPGAGGPGGFGARGGRGPGGFGGPPRPGQIMPAFLQERLNLTEEQKKKLDELQKEVDSKLARLLTDEQRKQLEEMRQRGPGGPGGPPPGGPPEPPDQD